MSHGDTDHAFAGGIPEFYDRFLVPLIFEPFAADLAARVAQRRPAHVLELAAGTGVLTRRLADTLPPEVRIVATDLNQSMLDYAKEIGTVRPIEWRPADALQIPFPDGCFDVVACQFGVMFFPDKAKAFAEAKRVLKPGGTFLFSAWDRLEENDFAAVVTDAVASLFPLDPPRFLARTPHGYHDRATMQRDLTAGGFDGAVEITTLAARSCAESPRIPAVAYCQGTPLRNEIEARDASRLTEATDLATAAIAARFGEGEVDGKIQGHIVTAGR